LQVEASRRWTHVALGIAGFFGATLAMTCLASLRPCSGGLWSVKPPAAWEQLRAHPLAPFAFSGDQLVEPPGFAPHQYTDAWIHDPALCKQPRSGVEAPGTYDATSLRLYEDASTATFVVRGTRLDADGKVVDRRTPFVAFRRSRVPRLVFTSGRWRAIAAVLAVATAGAAALARRAVRAPDRARGSAIAAIILTTVTGMLMAAAWVAVLVFDALVATSTYH
jgi:hypothetical protein